MYDTSFEARQEKFPENVVDKEDNKKLLLEKKSKKKSELDTVAIAAREEDDIRLAVETTLWK